jgi:ABC-type antimicrobial peptide transport system permease subunit
VATALGKAVLVLIPLFIGAFAGIYFSFTTDIWPRVFGFIICTVWAIAMIAIAVRAAWRAEWRRCLGWIVVLLAILPMSFVLAFRVGDYIHLAMMC